MRSASAPAGSPKMRMGSPRAKMISPSACPVLNSSSASHVKANWRNDCESAKVRLFAHSSVKFRDWNAENVCSESRRPEARAQP